MKRYLFAAISLIGIAAPWERAVAHPPPPPPPPPPQYTNFIRQIHMTTNVQWDVSVAQNGSQLAPFPILLGGSRFELWSIKSTPLTSYLLDTRYVNTYVPAAEVTVHSEDPYSVIPRTRADRPFWVDVTISGLLNGTDDPEPSKKVTLMHHVQSYGTGDGIGIDRSLATLVSTSEPHHNGTFTLNYAITQVPGADRSKVRGEERISVFSITDYQAPASQLAAQFIQIWPVADGAVSGITPNGLYKGKMPNFSIALNDLYPSSRTFAQVYKGDPQDGVQGVIIPGSALVINHTVPQTRILNIADWDNVFDADGRWTMEVLTLTPFGIDRLSSVTFDLDRTIHVNGSVSSIE